MTEREIFTEALEFADRGAQSAYLQRICGENVDLRDRVERLLELNQSAHSLLDHPPAEVFAKEGATIGLATLQPFLTPTDRPDSSGRLGHYEILEFLGQGGFGIVVKAFDTTLHRTVAIKVLAPHLAITSPPRKRFLREAWASAQVQHPNVVQVFAVEEQPLPYLVMEYVEGPTLQQRLDEVGPLDADEVIRIGRQIALGLAAAHEKGLIHRDVKPANILLQSGPHAAVKLTDFGIARAGDEASLTQSGVLAGTPLFMSPEQAQGAELDHRADLFSFGSVLYTIACGHPPFRAPNALAVLKRVTEDRPRPPLQIVPEIPPRLNAIILKLLEKAPAGRYASAGVVADELARIEGHRTEPRRSLPQSIAKLSAAAALLLILVVAWLVQGRIRPPAADPPAIAAAETNAPSEPPPSPAPQEAQPVRPTPLDSDPWSLEVAAMSPEEQVAAVIDRLKELNPELKSAEFSHRIENDVVKHVKVDKCAGLNDLTPLRALGGLEDLRFSGDGAADLRALRGLKLRVFETNGSLITDLSPLQGMPLQIMSLWVFRTNDLSPLAGMKLTSANLGSSPVEDLSVLRGMPLEYLCLNYSFVRDLSPLEKAPLKVLECQYTQVTSIAPLAGSPVETLLLKASPIADLAPLKTMPQLKRLSLTEPASHVELLRSLPGLELVNGKPVAELLNGP